jgi:hypothetical protein
MSSLKTYQSIVSEVYALTLSVTQGKYDAAKQQFDGFLESLRLALESTSTDENDLESPSAGIHIPPHLEILHDPKIEATNVVVFKDDMTKNVVLRNYPASQEQIKEDEDLEICPTPEVEEVEEEEEEEEEEKEAEEEETDEDVEAFEINGKKYYLAPESKMVFAYIDDETRGDQVGKLMNGNVVPL